MANYDELMAMRMPAVRAYAGHIGLGFNPAEKKADLVQRIVQVQSSIQPSRKEPEVIHDPKNDQLRTKPPAKNTTQAQIAEALKPYIERGLKLTFPDDDQFHMSYNGKEDSGNIRAPLRVFVRIADVLVR